MLTATTAVETNHAVAAVGPGLADITARLSSARVDVIAVTIGTKAVFAGSKSSPIDAADIYDDATGQWTVGRLSVARWQMGVAVAGGNALFAGGATGDNIGIPFDATNAVDIYNGATGRWSRAKLSVARWKIAGATAGNTALFAGGFTAQNTMSNLVDFYDTDSHEWSLAKLSQLRSDMAAASAGQLAFFAGGVRPEVNGQAVYSNVVDIYDASTGSWSTAKLSQARTQINVAVVGQKVIFAGGLQSNGQPSDAVDIYDAGTGRWSARKLSVARYFMGIAVVDGQAIFAGGFAGSDPNFFPIYENAVDIYDAAHDTWTTARLSQPGANYSGATTGDKAVFAGADVLTSEDIFSDVVETYDARTGRWSTTKLSQARRLIGATTVGVRAMFAGGDAGATIADVVDQFISDESQPTSQVVSATRLRKSSQVYTFTVSYHDNTRIDAHRIDDGDIIVTGPDKFAEHAKLVAQSRGRHGSTRIATYTVDDPGGLWGRSDNGVYEFHLQDDEIVDIAGNAAAGRRIGRFTVAITAPQSLDSPAVPSTTSAFQSKRKIDDLLWR